jgi:UDP-glucose 4-epimerase
LEHPDFKWYRDTDLIIHCAASYKDPEAWLQDANTNVVGAQVVARKAVEYGARIFYFQTVLPPISSYAISKIAGEHYLRLSGQPLTVFRLAGIYGPRNLSGAIPTFYKAIKAGQPCTVVEDATRDFVFIEDLVERVMTHVQTTLGEPGQDGSFDIRTGVETRISRIPYLIGALLGVEPQIKLIPRPPHDVPHYEMDGVPRVGTSFKEGLAKTVAWYEENGVGETFSHLGVLNG